MELKLASAMGRLGTETAFEVLAKAKALEAQGRSVIHLEIGEPDFDTPAHIVEAAKRALDEGYTHYGPAAGLPELREVIANEISTSRGVSVQPDQVVVTPGGKPVMFYAILALCETGDEVIYQNPGFPIYESMINFVGAKAVPLPLLEEKGFAFSLDDLKARITPRTKMLVINSPANPTGGIIPKEDLAAIAALALKHNFWVLSDEIYCRLQYEGTPASIIAEPGMADRTIILDGFSKTYAMTGWRVGYLIAPLPIAQAAARMHRTINGPMNAAVQRAALAAVTTETDWPERMRREYEARRQLVLDLLADCPGIHASPPEGTFYAFIRYDADAPATDIVAAALERGVAIRGGTEYGPSGKNHVRIAFSSSRADLTAGLRRLLPLFSTLER